MSDTSDSTNIIPGRRPSELYKLCFAHLPRHQKIEANNAVLDVAKISEEIGVSRQKIFLWLKNDRLPAHRVLEFVELAGSKLTMDLLRPFMSVGRKSPAKD